MKGGQIDTLQAGRATAALAVVAHHSFLAVRDFGGSANAIFDYGWAGVDFFFVLSGFIIAYSIDGKSLAEYTWHRVRRVYLPYLPIGAGLAFLYVVIPSFSAATRNWSLTTSLTLIPYGVPALSVAWTLQHELVFYTIFAVAWYTQSMWLLALWGLTCLLPIDLIPFRSINLEFLMGVVCFYACRRGIGSRWLLLAAVIPLAAWIALGTARGNSVLIGLAFATALPALLRMEREGLKVPSVATSLGGASYSIYLVHGVAISIAARIWPNLMICLVAGTSGGLAYYLLVEKSILKFTPKSFAHVSAA